MKTLKHIFAFVAALWLLSACQKSEIMEYNGSESLYFHITRDMYGNTDTINAAVWENTSIEFLKENKTELTRTFRILATGEPKDYDRTFRIVAGEGSSAIPGVNYEPLADEYVIKAGTLKTYITVRFISAPNIAEEQRQLVLEIEPNEHFSRTLSEITQKTNVGYTYQFKAYAHTVIMSNMMVQPVVWNGITVLTTKQEAGLLGAYSVKKIKLMFELFDLKYSDFASSTTMSNVRMNSIAQYMKVYLTEKFAEGTPLLEDDGRLMWVQGVTWTSIVGVPYKP